MITSACASLQLAACGGGTGAVVPGAASDASPRSLQSTLSQSTLSQSPLAAIPNTGRLWILEGPGLEAQAMATDPEGIKFFSNPSRTVLYPVKATVPAPASWKVILWHKYGSFAAFQSDINSGSVPAGTQIVGYDNEAWSFTPANEQREPIGYTIKFAQLAHAHGYKVFAMPAENIIQYRYPGQDKFTAFVKFGMAGLVAPYVDYYHIQSQDLQNVPASYASYTQQIVAQVHAANPRVVVTGGVSTNPPQAATAGDIDASIKASAQMVSGYWLNIVGATTPIASAALANLQ
jgi:hypothetical protein